MNPPTVSVVVPSLNGAERLPQLMEALLLQTHPANEVVVVLDGSTDQSEKVLEKYVKRLPLKIHRQENKGRAAARNVGVQHSNHDVLVFYDDDVSPHPNSIARHLEVLSRFGNVISVGQPLEPEKTDNEFGQYKAYLSRKWTAHLGLEPKVLNENDLFLTAANMAVSRRDFTTLDGFDENLSDAEDFDLVVRAVTTDTKMVFDPQNIVEHRSFDSFVDYIHRQRQYREAHRQLRQLRRDHPRFDLYNRYFVPISPWKRLAYFFIPSATPSWMDSGIFAVLPKTIKYGIYMRVISALSVYYPKRKI